MSTTIQEKISELGEQGQTVLADITRKTKKTARSTGHWLRSHLSAHPLFSVGGAVITGFIVGKLISRK